jgi:hypothetical protein
MCPRKEEEALRLFWGIGLERTRRETERICDKLQLLAVMMAKEIA